MANTLVIISALVALVPCLLFVNQQMSSLSFPWYQIHMKIGGSETYVWYEDDCVSWANAEDKWNTKDAETLD